MSDKQKKEFKYEGWMSLEAQKFFEGNLSKEERNTGTSIGSFVVLSNGKDHLPSKGDVFTKHEDGKITVKSIHKP